VKDKREIWTLRKEDLRSERKEIIRCKSALLVLDHGTFRSYSIFDL
jgi:hypothetical protein